MKFYRCFFLIVCRVGARTRSHTIIRFGWSCSLAWGPAVPIGLTRVSAGIPGNTPTFTRPFKSQTHQFFKSPHSSQWEEVQFSKMQRKTELPSDKNDEHPFPWWSQAHNGTLGEISPATLKAFKHGCLCTLKKRRNGLICVLITAMCGGRFYGVQWRKQGVCVRSWCLLQPVGHVSLWRQALIDWERLALQLRL